jgi:hypothetical protein
MFTIAGIILRLKSCASFLLDHWKVVLPVVIVVAMLLYINSIRSHSAMLESQLTSITTQSAQLKTDNDAKLASIKAANETALASIRKQRGSDLARFNLTSIDRDQLKNQLRNSNEQTKLIQTSLDRTKSNYDQRLRIETANRGTSGVSEESSDPSGPTTSQPERDAAVARLAVLEPACILTTIDFNTCRSLLDADTLSCGREK